MLRGSRLAWPVRRCRSLAVGCCSAAPTADPAAARRQACGVTHLRVNPDHVAALRYAGQADRLEVRHSSSRVRGRYAHETTVEVKSVHLVGLEVEHSRDIAHAHDIRCGHNRSELLARSQWAARSRTTDARCGRHASLQWRHDGRPVREAGRSKKAARRTLHCDVVLVDKVRLHREPLGLREAAVVHDKLVQQPLQMRPSFEGKVKRSLPHGLTTGIRGVPGTHCWVRWKSGRALVGPTFGPQAILCS